MGIRFACHVCEHKLNIKEDLAGRRGICPACSARFRIPRKDAEKSIPVDDDGSSSRIGVSKSDVTNSDATERSSLPEGVLSPTILDDDNDGTWYVRPPSGGQYGPATSELLKQWIGEGRIAATSLIWRDGWPQWRQASQAFPELVANLPDIQNATGWVSITAPTTNPNSNRPERTTGTLANSLPKPGKTPRLTGAANIGTHRRKRSNRRIYTIGILIAMVAALIGSLIFVLTR